jgi:hypothetical protein
MDASGQEHLQNDDHDPAQAHIEVLVEDLDLCQQFKTPSGRELYVDYVKRNLIEQWDWTGLQKADLVWLECMGECKLVASKPYLSTYSFPGTDLTYAQDLQSTVQSVNST